jgi:hypothetical protein
MGLDILGVKHVREMANTKSYLGDRCVRGIMNFVEKITDVEKQAKLCNQELICKLKEEIIEARDDI